MEVSLSQSRQAFPIVVFAHKCEDNTRKIMDISEEAKTQLGEISFTLPFSSAVKEQFQQGKLHVKTTDKRFEVRMQEIAGKVVAYGTD